MKQLLAAILLSACGGHAAETTVQDHSGTAGQSSGDVADSSTNGVDRAGCAVWNTEQFFESAVPENTTACLAAGADPNERDDDGLTPLHFAARYSENAAVPETPIAAGVDPNARDDDGLTPLQFAARYNENAAVT